MSAIKRRLDQSSGLKALRSVLTEGDDLEDRLGDLGAAKAESEIRRWKQRAMVAVEEHSPNYRDYFLSDPPRDLIQRAHRQAAGTSDPTGFSAIKQDFHDRLVRLHEIVREMEGQA
ncbi:MAG TPA: hypothetical protein VI028_02480 [Solirubrobacterales bacterium]